MDAKRSKNLLHFYAEIVKLCINHFGARGQENIFGG